MEEQMQPSERKKKEKADSKFSLHVVIIAYRPYWPMGRLFLSKLLMFPHQTGFIIGRYNIDEADTFKCNYYKSNMFINNNMCFINMPRNRRPVIREIDHLFFLAVNVLGSCFRQFQERILSGKNVNRCVEEIRIRKFQQLMPIELEARTSTRLSFFFVF